MTTNDSSDLAMPTPTLDVFATGPVFVDAIFANVPRMPSLGTEVFSGDFELSLGGIANVAVQASRLGLHTAVAGASGGGILGQWVRREMAVEGVNCTWLASLNDWSQPVTASIAGNGDRAMVTHFDTRTSPPRLISLPPARMYFEHIHHDGPIPLTDELAPLGARVVYDTSWDAEEIWDLGRLRVLSRAELFVPNEYEAMAFTRAATAIGAAKALTDLVPVAVVKCGPRGAVVAAEGEIIYEAAPFDAGPVLDTTGAGDVFVGALMAARLAELPLPEQVDFAVLCSGLAVTGLGGASAAPSWPRVGDAVAALTGATAERFGFVHQLREHLDSSPTPSTQEVPFHG